MVHTDMSPFFSSTFQGLFKDKSHFSKDLFSTQFDCFACTSCFLSAISACSHPFSRLQECGHHIDKMLFACPLSMHSSSLCIEGHVPTSNCISTGPSALLTP